MSSFARALRALPSPETSRDVGEIAEADPPTASREILGGYRALSDALGWWLHGDHPPENATFATFAAWSAQSLRADVSPPNDEVLPRRPARRLYDAATKLVLPDRAVVARNIAVGQAAIYEEIFPALHALLEATITAVHGAGTEQPDWHVVWRDLERKLVAHSQALAETRPVTARLEAIDATALQEGLAPYFEILRTARSATQTDSGRKDRAELILLGNLRLVAYEQRRLQPLLERNLEHLPQAVRFRLATRWLARPTLVSQVLTRAYLQVAPHVEVLDEAFQIAATRYVYSMTLGAEELPFGADLPLPPPAHPLLRDRQPDEDRERYADGEFFPYDLQVISMPELWAEFDKHDRSAGRGLRTAVDNWLRYPERLSFIANVFRSRQQMTTLYGRPSSAPVPQVPPPQLGRVRPPVTDATNSRLVSVFDQVTRDDTENPS